MLKKEYLWVAVTADKYELPIGVGSSAGDLAQLIGTTPGAIYKARYKGLNGRNTGYKIIKLEI